jgi:hypothetical protein
MPKTKTKSITKSTNSKTIKRRQGTQPKLGPGDEKFEQGLICNFLQMLNAVKLYHWKTHSYPTHKATDELYSKLNDNVDKFVEVLLGKFGNRISLVKTKSIPLRDMSSPEEFKREINKYKTFLVNLEKEPTMKKMTNTDLLNIRDEILGDLNQFLYLNTFK